MKLIKARVQKYRSIKDTDWFDIETEKTIMVGSNEAGKTAVLQALQQINPPQDVPNFNPLRDYPRSEYNDISTGKVDPKNVTVVSSKFMLEQADKDDIPEEFRNCIYVFSRKLDNSAIHELEGGPKIPTYGDIKSDLLRLCSHADSRTPVPAEGQPETPKPTALLNVVTRGWQDYYSISGDRAVALNTWLTSVLPNVDEENATEVTRHKRLSDSVKLSSKRDLALKELNSRLPIFVLFNNYFRVKPLIQLDHLAKRVETKVLDDEQYDYGNLCLLKLLGFTPRELSNLGRAAEPSQGDSEAVQKYRDQLDKRSYQLNAASVRLTNEIKSVWIPDQNKGEADKLRVQADGQYLKVVVEDDLGVEIELDQRSEGFQWLVSFFVVFFAEAADKHENAILLLDEPGLSLHGLKQREFRTTISRLAKENQTLYTTHSPFLVGPNELDIVRVVEMTDRKIGTKVHTSITANDPASLLPLQEALGYDLAQSLFAQQRNLVLEGLTDYWYFDALASLLREAGIADLNEKIAMVPAGSAGKVVYYATILHAQKLKVAALLDSDAAGDQAAQQEALVHILGNTGILRTKDVYTGDVKKPEIEDLLRETLIKVAKSEISWDVSATALSQPTRPIIDIFSAEIKDFSKYKLAKAFLRWTRTSNISDFSNDERDQWKALINTINKSLK